MNTCLNSRQIEVLINVGYFDKFGGRRKLLTLYSEFNKGKNKITKTLVEKTIEKRMSELKELESTLPDEDLSVSQQLNNENEYIGLCLSAKDTAPKNLYFVLDVDDKYGVKAKLYNVNRGTSGIVRLQKTSYTQTPFSTGQCIYIDNGSSRARYAFQNGTKVAIPGENDYWVTAYRIATEN